MSEQVVEAAARALCNVRQVEGSYWACRNHLWQMVAEGSSYCETGDSAARAALAAALPLLTPASPEAVIEAEVAEWRDRADWYRDNAPNAADRAVLDAADRYVERWEAPGPTVSLSETYVEARDNLCAAVRARRAEFGAARHPHPASAEPREPRGRDVSEQRWFMANADALLSGVERLRAAPGDADCWCEACGSLHAPPAGGVGR